MLINCPRCGFQQPKDKYCAQCGVDMETFRPAAPPLSKRIFNNLLVQGSLLLVIAGTAGYIIYEKRQENLQNRVSYLQSTVQISPSSKNAQGAEKTEEPILSASGDVPPPPPPPPTELTEAASTARSLADDTSTAAAITAETSPSPTTTAALAKSAAKSSPHLIVYYAEVSRAALDELISSSRGTGQYLSFNDYSAGILPNIAKALGNGQVKILHKEDRALGTQKSQQWFLGWTDPRDPSRQIGLNTYFELSEIDAANLRGNIELLRTWREEMAPGAFEVQKRAFPAIFEIGEETGFFMWGVLPRRSNLPNEDELIANDVYKILRSPQFRSRESEFVIFVDFDKGS